MITPHRIESVKQCEQNAFKKCSDLNDLRNILLNWYVVDDSYICFIVSLKLNVKISAALARCSFVCFLIQP